MKRLSSTQQWSQRRTEALLSLYKIEASPDFRTRVLTRMYARQALATVSPPSQNPCAGRWAWCSAWFQRTPQLLPHGFRLMPATVCVCLLLLSGVLVRWTGIQERPGATAPHEHSVLSPIPAPETPRTPQDTRFASVPDDHPPELRDSSPAATADTGPPAVLQRLTELEAMAHDLPPQAWLTPPLSGLPGASDVQALLKAEPQRSVTKRAFPSRPKRVKKGQSVDKHVST